MYRTEGTDFLSLELRVSLKGGKHTFELSSSGSDEVYGVCLKAVRVRQKVNGYSWLNVALLKPLVEPQAHDAEPSAR